ncbi:unnamed protein product [Onchocerca flexuosa]|uniref:Ovule protein n=1 Tax=Onchocerca flexuosa TaxID=387005 RepID=A0A183HFE2_9BILA|nr:unnamed protein product [Onchocerca flexuosa]
MEWGKGRKPKVTLNGQWGLGDPLKTVKSRPEHQYQLTAATIRGVGEGKGEGGTGYRIINSVYTARFMVKMKIKTI